MGTVRKLRSTGFVAAAGFALLGPAAVALAASGTFTGTTSEGNVCGSHFDSPCHVRVEVAHGYVGKSGTGESHIYWLARCKSGNNVAYSDVTKFWGPLKNGSLTVVGRVKRTGLGPRKNITAHNRISITVHVGQKVTGTLTDSSVITRNGRVINHCYTGTVSFTARR